MLGYEETHLAIDAIPLNSDESAIPLVSEYGMCKSCGSQVAVMDNDCTHYEDHLGYIRWRVRVTYQCKQCGKIEVHRLGGRVVQAGMYVFKNKAEA